MASPPPVQAVELSGGAVEYTWIEGRARGAPVVLLHEGLGCISLWRDFPIRLAAATGRSVLVWSRHGYGHSGPAVLPRRVDYMHAEAQAVLPELVTCLSLPPVVLIGHSDGASIALIAAGHHAVDVVGIGLLAPHVFVEDISVTGITAARQRYGSDERFRAGLARHHADPGATFRGWNDIWLDPAFRSWDITDVLSGIEVPVVAVQGRDDPYGTLAQLAAIRSGVSGSYEELVLDGTGHAPHLEQPDTVTLRIARSLAVLP